MKIFDAATNAYLASPGGNMVRVLLLIRARNRATGAIETLGLWPGEQDREFTIGGETHMFYRSAGHIELDEIISQPGTDVYMTSVALSPIDSIVRTMIGGYDLRFAPVEILRALFWPESGALVAEPVRLFRGWIDRMPEDLPEVGESAEIKVSLASAALALTRTLAFKKSDPALAAARSGDRFRRYADVGSVQVPWGEERFGATPPTQPPAFGANGAGLGGFFNGRSPDAGDR